MKFNDSPVYIVTGASSGIGKATALLLNEQGAIVIAVARRYDFLKSLINECKKPENMHIEIKDLSEDIERLPAYIKELKCKYGKFSGMAYCAGIGGADILQTAGIENFKKIFDINYLAPIFLTKGIADKRNNVSDNVSIVYIASQAATFPTKGQLFYASGKSALITTMKVIAKELSSKKIRCNTVSPAWVNTDMYKKTLEQYNANFGKYPFGIIEPNDVANYVAFLLSKESSKITGYNHIIDGGCIY